MVCSIGSGQMAAMARILAAVNFSQIISEEVGSQKLTAKHVQRELCDADEANLLDEEDMHIYDLMPLTDPLHLVCCNACKKPIKISQYAAHAEICKSVRIAEEMVSELNGGSGHKKRPKKERKKLTAAYASTPSEEQKGLGSTETDIKRNSSCVDQAPTIDGSGVSPGIPDYSTNTIPPPTKRSKLIPTEGVDKTDHLRADTGMAKSSCLNTQGAHTCGGLKGSTGRCKQFSEPVQVHGFCLQLQSKDIPAPLGTKVFYSLRNHRLRSAVKCMYYETFSEEQSDDVHLNASQGYEMELQASIPTKSHGELKGEKQPSSVVTSVRKPQQVLADCFDVYMGRSEHIPVRDFSNQDPVTNSQATSLGTMRSNYLPQSFSFAGNSGSSLGTMEQPKGSVPVT